MVPLSSLAATIGASSHHLLLEPFLKVLFLLGFEVWLSSDELPRLLLLVKEAVLLLHAWSPEFSTPPQLLALLARERSLIEASSLQVALTKRVSPSLEGNTWEMPQEEFPGIFAQKRESAPGSDGSPHSVYRCAGGIGPVPLGVHSFLLQWSALSLEFVPVAWCLFQGQPKVTSRSGSFVLLTPCVRAAGATESVRLSPPLYVLVAVIAPCSALIPRICVWCNVRCPTTFFRLQRQPSITAHAGGMPVVYCSPTLPLQTPVSTTDGSTLFWNERMFFIFARTF